MCFDAMWHYDDKCMTFDGEMQEEVDGRSIGEHDWSDLIEFQGDLIEKLVRKISFRKTCNGRWL